MQEALADELEEAYRSGVWLKERGRLGTHHGLTAARVDLLTPINEHKVSVLAVLWQGLLLWMVISWWWNLQGCVGQRSGA